MHLLAAQPVAGGDGAEAVDLGQTPAELVFLAAADTELALLAEARKRRTAGLEMRLANYLHLSHPMSVDLYVEQIIGSARLVVLRLLGGAGYWPYGVEQIAETCRRDGIALAMLPGDDQPDPELDGYSTLPREVRHRLWQYCVHGGARNADSFLNYASHLLGRGDSWIEPWPLPRAGLYWPGRDSPSLDDLTATWMEGVPVAAIVFYRALVQGTSLAPVDALIAALGRRGLNALPIYVAGLKDPSAAAVVRDLLDQTAPSVILNATGFAVSQPHGPRKETPFDGADCPVLQTIFAGGDVATWRASMRGLSARDLAMNVALPEVDGRILAGAVAFKAEARRDAATECAVVTLEPVADRIDRVAALAQRWTRLARTPARERRVAIILANYPNKDGRLANGVGLDTPAATVTVLKALADAGYAVDRCPADGQALIAALQAGPTNAKRTASRESRVRYRLSDYETYFATLPRAVREAITARWGAPDTDPFYCEGAFDLPVLPLGNVAVAVQPARGYNIDPVSTYHDPDLAPPHGYLAFYAWLDRAFGAHAVIHMGKHGTLEWLPGKAVALSENCFPDAVLAPLPHLYPFIVNDPGEGTQAKRRTAAVIIDHLTPPLTRADSYGPLRDLEQLVDEYYEASGLDPRRVKVLRAQILELSQSIGLDRDCGFVEAEGEGAALAKLDNYLCELKEMQIRDGLHVFGVSPEGALCVDLLVALTRVPRGSGEGGDASLIRALAADLGFDDFDPLDSVLGEPWQGPRPEILVGADAWRTNGDTVERLEELACRLVSGDQKSDPAWHATGAVLREIADRIRPAVAASGAAEIAGLLRGLDGRFVPPGPSGAPTRGRLDVLPTGRNFHSVDTRTVPTPAAWQLGWKSAGLLLDHYRQTHGRWPKSMAITAWGTANMRTGGDDIAQALALIGARPTWDGASRRVTGFEVMSLDLLDRPRIDVMLRISGFFRDAFPAQVALFDTAARNIGSLDEPEALNPIAARMRADRDRLVEEGVIPSDAAHRAGHRVFGSKPGAYGAGLQALIDERGWETSEDLARAYVAWGGYAYGAKTEGAAEHRLFERRLAATEAVVQNQDNREHDLLDSDDYYQFEGGMTVAVTALSGSVPAVYHNDHSRPESPRIRTLEDEIGRVVRARVVNPKWIAGVMRHGYKGAFEIAATIDYMFAFAATTRAVKDHHFDLAFDAFIADSAVRTFIETANPAAAREIAERLIEAQTRGMWKPRSNSARAVLEGIVAGDKEERS